MERSSRQSLRSERISGSPYRRPTQTTQTHKKSSSGSFATVKSFLSYLSPFRSSSTELSLPRTISDLPVEVEEASQSGSEDGWNGQPPTNMESADVFDLAAAAGREGNDFDKRTEEFRSKGEVPGGRRDLARRSLEGLPAPAPVTPATTATPAAANFTIPSSKQSLQDSHFANGAASTTSRRRARSPEVFTPQRGVAPTPSFLPPSATSSASGSSASSAALAAFLDAKRGQQMSQEDLNVIDSLTRNIHAESQVGTTAASHGGWSAAMSPRVTRAMPGGSSGIETPVRPTSGSSFNTPGSVFSVGTSTPGPSKASPYRVRYLGPGMSPKRMLGKGTSSSGIKPLFQFNLDSEESARKKARVEEPEETMEVASTPAPKATISSVASMPNLSSFASPSTTTEKGKAPVRPHPLSQSIVASPGKPRPTAEEIGRKRAADIMLEMIQQQEAVLPKPKSEIILNPYDTSGASVPPFSPASTRVIDSPRGSVLRATGRGTTPLRGAAARIANAKSSPSKSSQPPTPVPASKSSSSPGLQTQDKSEKAKKVAIATPVEATERSSAPSPVSARAKDNSLGEASTNESSSSDDSASIKPFDIPSFSTPSRISPIISARTKTVEKFDSPSQNLTLKAAKENMEQPTFTLPTLPPITQVEDDPIPNVYTAVSAKKDTVDPTKIYFTAKETALQVAEAALPFYTFTIPSTTTKDSAASKEAKEAALKADMPSFAFTMPTASAALTTNGFKLTVPASNATGADWTCDTCMLKNPDSAKDKCTICEAPRPGAKVPLAAAPAPFQWPSGPKPSGPTDQWECGTCMLKNPDSAKEKCTVCEAPRSKVTTTATSAPAATPFQWPSGSAPVKPKDEWTCTTCGLQNKLGSEKCTICEAPKP